MNVGTSGIVIREVIGGQIPQSIDNYRILLLHNKIYDWWELPGGKVEDNETILECVHREIKEESNINVHRVHFSHYFQHKGRDNHDNWLNMVFKCVCFCVNTKESSESDIYDAIDFFQISNLPPNMWNVATRCVLDFYMNEQKRRI